MKNKFFIAMLLFSGTILSNEWVNIHSSLEQSPNINVLTSDIENTMIESFKIRADEILN